MNSEQRIKLEGGELLYRPGYVRDTAALFAELAGAVQWQQPVLKIFGKHHKTPRLVAFVGDSGISYRYSGHRHQAAPWPGGVADLRDRLGRDYALEFNCALLNYYRDGNDSMGFHSDNEKDLGPSPAVASVSLGERRDFQLRRRSPAAQSLSGQASSGQPSSSQASSPHTLQLCLEDGALLLMLPPLQRYWQHALPRRRRQSGPRINITFRRVLGTVG